MVERTRLIAWGRELAVVHQRLRDAMAVVRDAVDDAEEAGAEDLLSAATADLLVYCRGFCSALDGHHRSEAAALSRPGATPQEVVRHLDGIEAVMETHFRYEEKVLAAALDELDDETLDLPTAFGPL